ncbi:MAG: crotonobetainyl-CoA--carnitine CoA-transferase [Kiritimatiellae bacterium]|nr:crotonobetainyl-CoA--carnitine CoA-transferase [Kiritimatiellia bacterium]MDD5521306.1 crotonobetainyl-CoA--carnitine CoA-transferase [Kiritimatiellia bacterium]
MKKIKEIRMIRYGNKQESSRREGMVTMLRACPVPDDELFLNIGMFLTPQTLSRVLFMDFLYRSILNIQGVVIDFGCRWGQNSSIFIACRGIYEPFNRIRKVIAFDTFQGHARMSPKDKATMKKGDYSVAAGYEKYLDSLLAYQEQESPISHVKKYEIVKGDASKTIHKYLKDNPETVVALAYFDFDVYKPTYDCLLAIKDRMTKGTVLGFDELIEPACPGETLALKEVLGLSRYSIKRSQYNARSSYLVID